MNELSIEEKAKRYDELLVKAKQIYNKENDVLIIRTIEDLFPKLKEREDEKIRKDLISHFKETIDNIRSEEIIPRNAKILVGKMQKWITWLEKQGEQKTTYTKEYDFYGTKFIPKFAKGDIVKDKKRGEVSTIEDFSYDTGLYTHTYGQFPITIQDNYELVEQKLADKVEPKFKVGDWIVFNGLTLLVNEVVQGYYRTISKDGIPNSYDWDIDNVARFWTIQDAKDGDVLYECNEKKPFIFKELETKHIGDIASYCDIFNGIFNPNEDNWTTLDIVPATKEQRDLLFQKMKEAGYKWDAEKKELKKIEQNLAWSEDDGI